MTKTKIFVGICAIAVAAVGLAWWADWFEPPLSDDPQVAEVQRLHRIVEAAGPDEERQAMLDMQAKAKQLDPAQQMAVFSDQFRDMMVEEEERLKQFFAQSEADQIKELDEQIDRLQAARRKLQSKSAQQPRRMVPKEPAKPSKVTGKTVIDITTPQFRALSLQFHQKLVGRMKQRGINP